METTPEQSRAAHALLKMSQVQLARAARVGVSTVMDFELGSRVQAIRIALELAGVMFTDDGGVKLAKGRRR
jgi:transcriptional regulator with XRE-family HTH domain